MALASVTADRRRQRQALLPRRRQRQAQLLRRRQRAISAQDQAIASGQMAFATQCRRMPASLPRALSTAEAIEATDDVQGRSED